MLAVVDPVVGVIETVEPDPIRHDRSEFGHGRRGPNCLEHVGLYELPARTALLEFLDCGQGLTLEPVDVVVA